MPDKNPLQATIFTRNDPTELEIAMNNFLNKHEFVIHGISYAISQSIGGSKYSVIITYTQMIIPEDPKDVEKDSYNRYS